MLLQILFMNEQLCCTPNVPCFCNAITVCLIEHVFEATKKVRQLYLFLSCDLKKERDRKQREREEKEKRRGRGKEKGKKKFTSNQVHISKHRLKLLNIW